MSSLALQYSTNFPVPVQFSRSFWRRKLKIWVPRDNKKWYFPCPCEEQSSMVFGAYFIEKWTGNSMSTPKWISVLISMDGVFLIPFRNKNDISLRINKMCIPMAISTTNFPADLCNEKWVFLGWTLMLWIYGSPMSILKKTNCRAFQNSKWKVGFLHARVDPVLAWEVHKRSFCVLEKLHSDGQNARNSFYQWKSTRDSYKVFKVEQKSIFVYLLWL